MSRLVYNSVELSYISTQEISDEVVLDESGTDYLHTNRTITVSAIIASNVLPSFQDESRDAIMRRIRHHLEVPRKTLLFYADNDSPIPLFQSPVEGQTVDAANGPFPRVLSIREVRGTGLFCVMFSVRTAVVECDGGVMPPYTSNRWRDTITIDERFATRRVRSGRIYRRSDSDFDLEHMREFAYADCGRVPFGFQRESSTWTFQEDGLAAQYEFVDRELYLPPPAPSIRASGKYRESTQTPGGAVRFAECQVTLEGAIVGNDLEAQKGKMALIAMAILVAAYKVGLARVIPTLEGLRLPTLFAAGIEEEMYENKVSVMMRVLLPAGADRVGGLPLLLHRFGVYPTGSEPFSPLTGVPSGGLRGSAQLMALAAGFGDPCLQRNTLTARPPGPDEENNLRTRSDEWDETLPPPQFRTFTRLPPDQEALWRARPFTVSIRSETFTRIRSKPNTIWLSTTNGPVGVRVAKPEVIKEVKLHQKDQGEKPELLPMQRPVDEDGEEIPVVDAWWNIGAPKASGDGTDVETEQSGMAKFAPEAADKAFLGIGKDGNLPSTAHPGLYWQDRGPYANEGRFSLIDLGGAKVQEFGWWRDREGEGRDAFEIEDESPEG